MTGPYLQGIPTRIQRHAAGIITVLYGTMLMHGIIGLPHMVVIAAAAQMGATGTAGIAVGVLMRVGVGAGAGAGAGVGVCVGVQIAA